ncbi:MAG: hypothetical protein ACYTGZ_10155 [Planctomycetota bacterium]|jgi:hypothetical protein
MPEASEPPLEVAFLHEIPEDRAHDAREHAEEFQRLPEEAKDDLRDRWRRAEGQTVRMKTLRRYSIRGYVIEMMVTFVFFHFFVILFHPWILPVAIVIGGLTGWVAAKLRAGTSLYPAITFAGYLLMVMLGAGANPFAALSLVSLSALLGYSHTMRRFDQAET